MSQIAALVEELRHESAATRNLLERVPEEHLDWKPHAKSMTLRELVSHIVEIPTWMAPTFEQDEFTIDPETYKPWLAKGTKDALETFGRNAESAAKVLGAQDEAALGKPWSLKIGGEAGGATAFTIPKGGVVRGFILSHTIHHRGQLEVYLRLKDVPLPQIYGPTADEPEMLPPA